MAWFEMSPHPEHTEERLLSSLRLVDSTVRVLGLTTIDLDNPASSVFPKEFPPMILDGAAAPTYVSLVPFWSLNF